MKTRKTKSKGQREQTVRCRCEAVSNPTHAGPCPCGSRWQKSRGSPVAHAASAAQQCAVTKWPANTTPGGGVFGLSDARASALIAKRGRFSLKAFPVGFIRLRRRATWVLRVATWRKRSFLLTIEDPRRSRLGGITERYKAVPKCAPQATLSGTSLLRPAVWGSQLDQSSGQKPSKVDPQEVCVGSGAREELALQLKPQSARAGYNNAQVPRARRASEISPVLRPGIFVQNNDPAQRAADADPERSLSVALRTLWPFLMDPTPV